MNTMKILLVEDNKQQQDAFENSVEVLKDRDDINVEHKITEDISGALKEIEDGSYDGAIIDLRLGNDEEGGNKVVSQLRDPFTRIPIIFVTAFVDSVGDHPSVIRKRLREDGTYESDLMLFQEIYNTGLTRIIGGRGIIEKSLSKIFLKNLLPHRKAWVSYGKKYLEEDPERTEKALLRYTLNHLFQLLEESNESCFPEEVYLHPPLSDDITTGSIVKEETSDVEEETSDQWFVILSPACDLVPRGENGESNTDHILLVEIERADKVVGKVLRGSSSNKDRKNRLNALFTNRTQYYHWLPETNFFDGGFLNFRKLKTLSEDEFREQFEKPSIQISPPFVKDIVSRFSTYYARQGQPDIDSKAFVDGYTQQQNEGQ